MRHRRCERDEGQTSDWNSEQRPDSGTRPERRAEGSSGANPPPPGPQRQRVAGATIITFTISPSRNVVTSAGGGSTSSPAQRSRPSPESERPDPRPRETPAGRRAADASRARSARTRLRSRDGRARPLDRVAGAGADRAAGLGCADPHPVRRVRLGSVARRPRRGPPRPRDPRRCRCAMSGVPDPAREPVQCSLRSLLRVVSVELLICY